MFVIMMLIKIEKNTIEEKKTPLHFSENHGFQKYTS